MKKFLAVAGLAAVMAMPALAGTTTWNLDPFHESGAGAPATPPR